MKKADKRCFRRYKKKHNFNLFVEGKQYQAETIDYSLCGLGVHIEDSPPVKKGMQFDINVDDVGVWPSAEIVWIKKSGSGTECGLKNCGQIRGSFFSYHFSDVLIGLQRTRKTGILEAKSGSSVKHIYIKNGDIIFARSDKLEDSLGDLLLRTGRINKEQYERSVEVLKATGKRQGTVLVELGVLKPRELVWAVRFQVEEIILGLFGPKDVEFEFKEEPLPDEVITLKISAANLIYHGLKKRDDDFDYAQNLPADDIILGFSEDPQNLYQDITLDLNDKKILACIGKRSMREILSLSPLDKGETLRTLYALLNVGIIEEMSKDTPAPDIPAEAIHDILEEKTGIVIDPAVKEMIEDMWKKHEKLGYYGVLGVKDTAATAQIKSAYYKAAKKFHPDRHFHAADDSLKDKLSDIFSYVYEAYSVLSDPIKRKEYDRLLEIKPVKLTANQDIAKAKFEEGKIEFRRSKYSEAAVLFGQAVYFDMTIADYYYYYALTLQKLEKFKEAEKAITKALKLDPFNPSYIAESGYIYLGLGFALRAKGLFEKSLKLSPQNQRALEGLQKLGVDGQPART